ncbi:hypothetical protein ACQ86D_15445 [Streptomyces galilaeus]
MRRLLLPLVLFTVFLLAGGLASPAGAHPMATSAVLLDLRADRVTGEVELPVDRLAIAVHRDLTPAAVTTTDRASLHRYTAAHIAATGTDGTPGPSPSAPARSARSTAHRTSCTR